MLLTIPVIWVYVLAFLMIGSSLSLYLARLRRPDLAILYRYITIVLGILGLSLIILAIRSKVPLENWLFPLLYMFISLGSLLVDVLLKAVFRQVIEPKVLIPFLILLVVPLIGFWFYLGTLGMIYWSIVSVVYFLILTSAFFAIFGLMKSKE